LSFYLKSLRLLRKKYLSSRVYSSMRLDHSQFCRSTVNLSAPRCPSQLRSLASPLATLVQCRVESCSLNKIVRPLWFTSRSLGNTCAIVT
jgi:hypothetical protein